MLRIVKVVFNTFHSSWKLLKQNQRRRVLTSSGVKNRVLQKLKNCNSTPSTDK